MPDIPDVGTFLEGAKYVARWLERVAPLGGIDIMSKNSIWPPLPPRKGKIIATANTLAELHKMLRDMGGRKIP
jgi:hypothetical protein